MPADLASDDDPDCIAVALPHPYAPRRPKATGLEDAEDDARDRQDVVQSLFTSPRALFCDPRAAGGVRGVPRVIDATAVLEVPKAPSEAPERDHGFLGVVERLRQVLGIYAFSNAHLHLNSCDSKEMLIDAFKAISRDPRAAGSMRGRPRVIVAIAVLEVPKASPDPPERECGFLGVVEDLHQALGVIAPFLRDPRAAGGKRGRPRVMNATTPKQLFTREAARAARSREAARMRSPIPLHAAPTHDPRRGETMPVRREDLTSMFIISKNASSPHSTPLDNGLRAMRHPFDQLPSPITPPLNPAISQQARSTTACKRGGKKEGKRIFPSSKEAVYAPLPRPGIDEEALDFEGGGVGVGGFSTLINR
ncbi:hypothetical protein EV122DRAFT_285465 [Schizophyllum commune]